MKKFVVGLMVAASLLTFGCSGRNAEFGVVDVQKVETEAASIKTIKEDTNKKLKEMQGEAEKALSACNSEEEAKKVMGEFEAKANLVKTEAINKMKSNLDTAIAQVAKEKNLGAVLVKPAVSQGGKDITKEVLDKMK